LYRKLTAFKVFNIRRENTGARQVSFCMLLATKNKQLEFTGVWEEA